MLIFTKLPNPIREIRVSKLVFITIPCLKFWAQGSNYWMVLQQDLQILVLVQYLYTPDTCTHQSRLLSVKLTQHVLCKQMQTGKIYVSKLYSWNHLELEFSSKTCSICQISLKCIFITLYIVQNRWWRNEMTK